MPILVEYYASIPSYHFQLSYYKNLSKIEKIKVINWTYMAACGFDVIAAASTESLLQRSAYLPNKARSNSQDTTEEQRSSDTSTIRYRTSYQHNAFRLGNLHLYPSDSNIDGEDQPRIARPTVYEPPAEGSNTNSDVSIGSEEHAGTSKVLVPSEDSNDSDLEVIETFSDKKISSHSLQKANSDQFRARYHLAIDNYSHTNINIINNIENPINIDRNENSLNNHNNMNYYINTDNNSMDDDYDDILHQHRFSQLSDNIDYPNRVYSRRKPSTASEKYSPFKPAKRNHNVFVCKALAHFASDLLKVVDSINQHLRDKMGTDFLPLKLRIGML